MIRGTGALLGALALVGAAQADPFDPFQAAGIDPRPGAQVPLDLAFHDQAGCAAAKLPDPPTAVNILTLLLESERCAIRSWSAVCDMTFGKDPRTYDLAARMLNEEIEHEAWFIELLAHERDGKSIPSGHFRRGEPGEAPYSKNRRFYNP